MQHVAGHPRTFAHLTTAQQAGAALLQKMHAPASANAMQAKLSEPKAAGAKTAKPKATKAVSARRKPA
jgi:hypothetical protein